MVAPGIEELPDELFLRILGFLDVSSLKKARLTSLRWAAVGACARSLFRRIYFNPLPEAMEMFSEITLNPAFASRVDELVYDARMFWPHLDDEGVFDEAYKCYYSKPLYGSIRYNSEYQFYTKPGREDNFLESRRRCGELQKKTRSHSQRRSGQAVCEKFTPEHGSMARARINPTWPASLMEKLSGGTIPPIASESSTYGFHDYLNQGTITDIRFDCQHIVNLLDAVVSQCTMVREIHIGHQNAPMNLAIIADDRVLRSLQILVPQLKTLELHCRTGCQTEDPDFTKLTSLIQSAQNLQHLSINIGKYLWLWTKLLNELHFPHLVVLDIADIWLRTAVELEMFLSRHRKKLRKLTLEKGKLSMLAWDELSIAIGATLKLDYICLDSLSGPLALPTPTNDSLSADEMDLLVSYFMGESPFVIQRYGRQTTFGEEYVVLGYRQGCEPEEIPYEKEFLLHNVSFVN